MWCRLNEMLTMDNAIRYFTICMAHVTFWIQGTWILGQSILNSYFPTTSRSSCSYSAALNIYLTILSQWGPYTCPLSSSFGTEPDLSIWPLPCYLISLFALNCLLLCGSYCCPYLMSSDANLTVSLKDIACSLTGQVLKSDGLPEQFPSPWHFYSVN